MREKLAGLVSPGILIGKQQIARRRRKDKPHGSLQGAIALFYEYTQIVSSIRVEVLDGVVRAVAEVEDVRAGDGGGIKGRAQCQGCNVTRQEAFAVHPVSPAISNWLSLLQRIRHSLGVVAFLLLVNDLRGLNCIDPVRFTILRRYRHRSFRSRLRINTENGCRELGASVNNAIHRVSLRTMKSAERCDQ